MTDTKPDESYSQSLEDETSWSTLRESKGISLETIEHQTNIPIRKLEALERKDFASLGTETFVLGYLRRYAKILEVDPEIFIETYRASREGQSEDEIPSAKKVSRLNDKERKHLKDRPKKIPLAAISIIIFVVWVGVMLLLPGEDGGNEKVQGEPNGGVSSQVVSTQDEAVSDGASESSREDNGQDMRESFDVSETDSAPASLATDSIADVQNASVDGEDENENEQRFTSNGVEGDVEGNGESNELNSGRSVEADENPAEQNAAVASSGEDVILMSFTDDCWVEIKDAQENVIFAQLQTKEDNLQIFGQAPFSVMLGNARAATVSLNGNPVSTTPEGGQKTLRLRLSN